jgi:hypothetical protein
VAEDQRRFEEAEDAYKKALKIYVAFDDRHRAAIVLRSIARLWAATSASSIPATVSAILKIEIEQARYLLGKAAEAGPASPPPDQS